jgi:outer membrane beta-barrel protein
MRHHRKTTIRATLCVLAAVLFWFGNTALAQKKDPKKPPPKEEEEPEIEIDDTEIEPDDGGGDGDDPGGGDGGDDGDIEIEADTAEGDLEADTAELEAADAAAEQALKTEGPLGEYRVSWQDIVVVIRKPFLKVRRWEMLPMLSTTMNDNMIRHYGAGAQINHYLTDVLAVGVEGHYLTKQFREPFDLVARQARRLPTINKYNFTAGVNFHYVPVYGKFAVLDKHILTWETFFTAGLGVTQSEVIPRDPKFEAFSNLLITPNIGASMRFFLFKWLTINLSIKDYLFIDKYEPVDRSETMNTSAEAAKENADSAFVNNVMFQVGVSFWLPPTFEYTTFR